MTVIGELTVGSLPADWLAGKAVRGQAKMPKVNQVIVATVSSIGHGLLLTIT